MLTVTREPPRPRKQACLENPGGEWTKCWFTLRGYLLQGLLRKNLLERRGVQTHRLLSVLLSSPCGRMAIRNVRHTARELQEARRCGLCNNHQVRGTCPAPG